MPKTLFDKVWDAHVVRQETADTPGVLYVDLHLVHEVTSPQAFSEIEARGLKVRRPDRTYATLDHSTPTLPAGPDGTKPYVTPQAEAQVHTLERNCAAHGVPLAGWCSDDRGVVHVMGPELGLTQPGLTVVCGDSHTATHGAFGALAFGIGTSEVGHVLATQCLLQRKARSMRVTVNGQLQPGVSGKDVALGSAGVAVLQAAFATRESSESELLETQNGEYFVVRTERITPARIPALTEVEARVKEAWQNDERRKLADIRVPAVKQVEPSCGVCLERVRQVHRICQHNVGTPVAVLEAGMDLVRHTQRTCTITHFMEQEVLKRLRRGVW